MSTSAVKRMVAAVTVVIFIIFLSLSPVAELYGEHDHSCSANDCLICLVANALSDLRTSFGAFVCAAAIFLFIYVCESIRLGEVRCYVSSPVALKTKITS